jgi:dTDP-4-dehydrorhamnose 3,5-epimerase
MISGVEFKELATHTDERGFFREIIRTSDSFFDEFGQWSHSLMYSGVIKAWHVHSLQTDWWYVVGGVLRVALHDTREDSSTYRETMEFLMGEDQEAVVVKIPPGVAHGCRCISSSAHLFYVTSRIYDPSDEGRIPHDDPEIGYDWVSGPPIK